MPSTAIVSSPKATELIESAPVSESTYNKISEIYDVFSDSGYEIGDLIRIDGKHPAVIALGNNETLLIGTLVGNDDVLENVMKRIELCFADTLEGIKISTKILCVSGKKSNMDDKILHFVSVDALRKYLEQHKNVRPTTKQDWETFDAYADYIRIAMEYLFKPNK